MRALCLPPELQEARRAKSVPREAINRALMEHFGALRCLNPRQNSRLMRRLRAIPNNWEKK